MDMKIQINFKVITLNESSQTKKTLHCMILFIKCKLISRDRRMLAWGRGQMEGQNTKGPEKSLGADRDIPYLDCRSHFIGIHNC